LISIQHSGLSVGILIQALVILLLYVTCIFHSISDSM
jgi:hypothetical protein